MEGWPPEGTQGTLRGRGRGSTLSGLVAARFLTFLCNDRPRLRHEIRQKEDPMRQRFPLTLCLGVALAACGNAMDAASPEDTLHEPPPAAISLAFREVPLPSSATQLGAGGRTLSLAIGSRSTERVRVELRARIDDGTTGSQVRLLGEVDLAPHEQAVRPIDLGALTTPVADNAPAGLLRVTAVVRASAEQAQQVQAPAVYFRAGRAAGALVVSGEDALRRELAAYAETARGEEPTVTDRIVAWSPQTASLPRLPSDPQAGRAGEVRP